MSQCVRVCTHISCISMSDDVCAVSRTQEHVLWVICMNAVVVFLFGKLSAPHETCNTCTVCVCGRVCTVVMEQCAVSEETCVPAPP